MAKSSTRKITSTYLRGLPKELKELLGPLDGGALRESFADEEQQPKLSKPLRNKSVGDKGAPKKRSSMRQYKKEVQGLWRHLHRQLYKIYGGFVVSPNDRGAHIRLWYNGELRELNLACRKVANLCESLIEAVETQKNRGKE